MGAMSEPVDLERLAGWASYLMECIVTSAQLRRLAAAGVLTELNASAVDGWTERDAVRAAKGDAERVESLIAAAEARGKAALAKYPATVVVLLDGKEGDERVAAVLRLRHVEPYYQLQVSERDKEFGAALRGILDKRVEETRAGNGLPFADNHWLNKEFPWIVNREYPTLRSTMPLPELTEETKEIPSAVDYQAIELCERLPENFPAHGSNGGNDKDGGLGMKPPEYVALLLSDNGRSGAKVVGRVVFSNIKRLVEVESDVLVKGETERISRRRNLRAINSHDRDPFDPEWITGHFITALRTSVPGLVITDPVKADSDFADRYFAAEILAKVPDWMRGFRVHGEVSTGEPQL